MRPIFESIPGRVVTSAAAVLLGGLTLSACSSANSAENNLPPSCTVSFIQPGNDAPKEVVAHITAHGSKIEDVSYTFTHSDQSPADPADKILTAQPGVPVDVPSGYESNGSNVYGSLNAVGPNDIPNSVEPPECSSLIS